MGNLLTYVARSFFYGFLLAAITGMTESINFLYFANKTIAPNYQADFSLIVISLLFYGLWGALFGLGLSAICLIIASPLKKKEKSVIVKATALLLFGWFYLKLFSISLWSNIFRDPLPLAIFLVIPFISFLFFKVITYLTSKSFSIVGYYLRPKRILWGIVLPLITLVLFYFYFDIYPKGKAPLFENGRSLKPNILLIVLDTARADHFSCYGYKRETTPNLDKFASGGVLFKNAISASSWTLPSHASIFTGKYPSEHGANYKSPYLDQSNVTLAEIVNEHGWYTLGFTGNSWISKKVGMTQGFSFFDEDVDRIGFLSNATQLRHLKLTKKMIREGYDDMIPYKRYIFPNGYRKADEFLPAIIKKLKYRSTDRPFFLFINFNDPHTPYEPPKNFRMFVEKGRRFGFRVEFSNLAGKRDRKSGKFHLSKDFYRHLNDLYDGEVRFVDHYLGKLFAGLKELELWENTVIIVTADHGESIGEHGLWDHGHSLYIEQVSVPLIISYPAKFNGGIAVEALVETVDIFPTVLDLVGLNTETYISGRSLRGYLQAESKEEKKEGKAISEIFEDPFYARNIVAFKQDLKSIRDGNETFISSSQGAKEYYDRFPDPLEEDNLFFEARNKAERLEIILKEYEERVKDIQFGNPPDFDLDFKEKLKALGYVE
jgi:arylsulfatase A-like enzyme